MAENNKHFTENEKNPLNIGFLSAISSIYHKLDASKQEDFKNMVIEAIGEKNFTDAEAEKANDSSENGGCPKDCHYERGLGCVC